MNIFDQLGKLITEHASASVQKERLELAREQYAALERKLADANAENQALKKENERLTTENQRLSAQLSKSSAPASALQTLDDQKTKILIVVARQQDDAISARDVAGALSLHVIAVEQALADLAREKFVHVHRYLGKAPPDFSLAENGRKYLIANNLLGAVGKPAPRDPFSGFSGFIDS